MKKFKTTFIVSFIFLINFSCAFGQPNPQGSSTTNTSVSLDTTKVITLKDGTVIKGKLLGLENGIYTVESTHLGTIHLHDDDIASITSGNAAIPMTGAIAPQSLGTLPNTMPQVQTPLQGQAMGLQQKLLSDPQAMTEIQALAQDPQIMELLSDKDFVNAIMSYDPEKIKNNPKTQMLLDNPKIRSLMNRAAQGQTQGQEQDSNH